MPRNDAEARRHAARYVVLLIHAERDNLEDFYEPLSSFDEDEEARFTLALSELTDELLTRSNPPETAPAKDKSDDAG